MFMLFFISLPFDNLPGVPQTPYVPSLDSLNVRFVGNWPFGPSYAVAYDPVSNLVFAGSGCGVYIFDVSDPDTCVKLSDDIRTMGNVLQLVYDEGKQILYLSCGDGGIEVWDVSVPAEPVLLKRKIYDGIFTFRIALYGDYIYMASIDTVVHILDADSLSMVDSFFVKDRALILFPSGSYLYIAEVNYEEGYQVLESYDISSPLSPVWLDTLYFIFLWACMDMDINGDYLYIPIFDGLLGVNVSDPSNLSRAFFYDFPGDNAYYIDVYESLCWVSASDSGGYLFDVSDPVSPLLLSVFKDTCIDCEIYGNYAYLAAGDAFEIVDISNSSLPALKTIWQLPGDMTDFIRVGDYVYAGYGTFSFGYGRNEIWILDVSSPNKPYDIMHFAVPDAVNDFFLSGMRLYAAMGDTGVWIYDVSVPDTPQVVDSFLVGIEIENLWVDSPYIYLALGDSGVWVYEDGTFNLVERVNAKNRALDVLLADGYLFVADDDSGVVIFDASNPESLKEIAVCSLMNVYCLDYKSGYLFVAGDGWSIVDVSDPSNPVKVYSSSVPRYTRAIKVDSNYCYVGAIWGEGLYVFDVSVPDSAECAGYYNQSGVWNTEVEEPYIYAHVWTKGLWIFENLLLQGVERREISSSPVLLATGDYLALEERGVFMLYDVSGRKVKEGIGREIYVGDLMPGVYFLVVDAGTGRETFKVVRLR
ncbi:hypothetical protein DRQ20_05920 [bacterium]|nr:MAG: hypothetical protein DRQ20_05920 [bacterium]